MKNNNDEPSFYRKIFILKTLFLIFTNSSSFSQNLIAYYKFNNNAEDSSLNNNTGILFGGVETTTDRFGNPCGALKFNGTDGYIEVPNSPSLQSPSNAFSVSCWFKIEKSSTTGDLKWLTLICKGGEPIESNINPQYRVQVFQSHTLMKSTVSINTDFTEYDNDFIHHSFEYGKWNFYVLVYDGKMVKTYINNKKVWEFPYNKNFIVNDKPLQIGKDIPGNTEYFCGALDDLRIYNNAISETQINQLFMDNSGSIFKDEYTLECPQNIFANTEPGGCYSIVNFSSPSLIVNCSSVDLKQVVGQTSGSIFQIGNNPIVYKATSKNGNEQVCSFNIIVKDIEPPQIQCNNDTTIFISNLDSTDFKYNFKPPSATDNCLIDNITLLDGPPSGSIFPEGKTALKYRATDKAGNISDCTYNIIIIKKDEKKIIDSIHYKIVIDSLKLNTKTIINSDTQKFIASSNLIGEKQIKEEHELSVYDSIITVVMFDDSDEDFDTVSIFFNDQLIVDRQMIKLKKHGTIKRVISIKPNENNFFISKAWNVGLVAPNTLTIELYNGDWSKNFKRLKKTKPFAVKVLHSKPGVASAILLRFNK